MNQFNIDTRKVELRSFPLQTRSVGKGEMYVEGYAALFNNTTILWENNGTELKERIATGAFEDADMSDVIFNYNHGGKVMARTRNKTLELKVDSKGLFIRARLDGTDEGRKLHEEIKGGYIDRMSFAFSVEDDFFNQSTYTRTIKKIKRIYDVSAVAIPAYDDTSIGARTFSINSVLEEKRLQLKMFMDSMK